MRLFIRTPTGRRRLNVLGALDFVTRELVTVTNTTYVTAQTVCELLETLAKRYPGQAITLVLDNARYQRCRLVQERATALDIQLTFLPSYSPHLNLIERIWGLLKKRCLNGQYYETFDLFQQAIHFNKPSTTASPSWPPTTNPTSKPSSHATSNTSTIGQS